MGKRVTLWLQEENVQLSCPVHGKKQQPGTARIPSVSEIEELIKQDAERGNPQTEVAAAVHLYLYLQKSSTVPKKKNK